MDTHVVCVSMKEHVEQLERVLEAHQRAGIMVNPAKTQLFQTKVQYLGHQLSEQGIEMVPEYIDKIMKWPSPKTVTELNSALGFFSYYRSYLPDFSSLTAAMSKEKKKKTLEWTQEMEDNFKELKRRFAKAPIRSVPDYSKDSECFRLTTDYSGQAISAILSQYQDGQERLICAAGRKTTSPESRYSSWKGELSAVVFGLRKFESILRYKPFEVITDSSALKHLDTLRQNKGMIARWLEEIAGFQFTVIHRAGKRNLNADGMSRSSHLPEPTAREEQEQKEYICSMEMQGFLDRSMIREHQKKDEVLREVAIWIETKKAPTWQELRGKPYELHRFQDVYQRLSFDDDGLMILSGKANSFDEESTEWLVLPQALFGEMFTQVHRHRTAGHFGITATVRRANRYFYAPGMSEYIKREVTACADCLGKVTKVNLKAGVHIPKRGSYVMECLNVDLVGPLPVTQDGKKYILTVEDQYSRFCQAYPLANKTTQTVANTLMDRWVATFGAPYSIHSDRGTEFTSEVFGALMKLLNVRKSTTPPYSPQSNSIERFHRSLNAIMRVYLDREDVGWSKHLPCAVLAYNSKCHSSTGATPAMAFMGRELKLPLDLIVTLPTSNVPSIPDHVRDLAGRYARMFSYMRKHGEAVIRRNADQYYGQPNDWEPGMLVWYFTPRKLAGKPGKLTNQWTGPFRVEKRETQVLVAIKPAHQEGRTILAHIGRLRPYAGPMENQGTSQVPGRLQLDDEEDVAAEEVTNTASRPTESLAVPIRTVTASTGMVDLSVAKKDSVEEPLKLGDASVPEDAVLPTAMEDEVEPETETVGDEMVVEEPKAEAGDEPPQEETMTDVEQPQGETLDDEPPQGEMDAESRGVRRPLSDSSDGSTPERISPRRTKRRRVLREARKLLVSDSSSSAGPNSSSEASGEDVPGQQCQQVTQGVPDRRMHQFGAQFSSRPGSVTYCLRSKVHYRLQPGETLVVETTTEIVPGKNESVVLLGFPSASGHELAVHTGFMNPHYQGIIYVPLQNQGKRVIEIQEDAPVALCLVQHV